jgi:hypothetical protein
VKNRFQSLPFKFNLQRYTVELTLVPDRVTSIVEVGGGCTRFGMQLTHSLKARGFNP